MTRMQEVSIYWNYSTALHRGTVPAPVLDRRIDILLDYTEVSQWLVGKLQAMKKRLQQKDAA